MDILLEAYRPRLTRTQGALLTDAILEQGRPVLDWVIRQAACYREAFPYPKWDWADHDHAAALDVLIWQLGDRLLAANRWDASTKIIHMLEGIQEAASTFKEINQ